MADKFIDEIGVIL